MKLVHHETGHWIRSDCDTAATRSEARVTEYAALDDIENKFVRDTFAWMLENGIAVVNSGSDVFQIRNEVQA